MRVDSIHAGQHAVVTGGSSGLGLLLAEKLVTAGVRTTILARDETKLAAASARLRSKAPAVEIRVIAVDVSDAEAVERSFADLASTAGGIDMLVNSAGILREGYFEDLDPSVFHDVMNTDFFGVVNTVRGALPFLKASNGRIVNVASVAGLTGVFGYTPYCAAKHALVGFTESLRFELEPQGVSVQLVCPGEFDSPMVDILDRTRTPENRAHTLMIPKLPIEQIANEIVEGIRRNTRRIIPGWRTRLMVHASRLAPSSARRAAEHRITRARG